MMPYIRRYVDGESSTLLSAELGTYPAAFLSIVRRSGQAVRSRGRPIGSRSVSDVRSALCKVTLDDEKEILRQFDEGLPLHVIGGLHNITRERVRQIVKREGRQPRGWRFNTRRIELPMDRLRMDCNAGLSASEMASKYGCGYETLKRRLAEIGIKAIHARRLRLDLETVKNQYRTMGCYRVGKLNGCSGPTVLRFLHRHGIKTRKSGHRP